ncbi:MAG: C10 family peptidase [Muribaculaceae bacterium]|nr:C10 family peptidase [Muribaculaceae bacterium]
MDFKKILISGLLAVVGMTYGIAGNVNADAARVAAGKFLQNHRTTFKSSSISNLTLAHTEASSVEGNAYYVFNVSGGGWVIVAGDDRAKQILAYGDKGNIDMNEMPASMKGQLDTYKKQIEAIQSYKGKLVPNRAPQRYNPVAPLTKTTWGQQEPMNRYTPLKNGEKTAVGCGPLAMAQICYYWKYPAGSEAMGGYYVYSGCGTVPALEATTFEYDKMLKKYTIYNPETGGVSLGTYTEEQAEAVARLCRYTGHACQVRYGNSGTSSGAYSYDQLAAFKQFGFNEGAQLIGFDPSYYCANFGNGKYTEEAWIALIVVELEAGRPIAYHNVDFTDGHAWVLDGIDADGKLHMNWGFYERFDGWFEFGAFAFHPYGDDEVWNFSADNSGSNEMIINLYPYEGYVIPGDEPTGLRGDVDGDGKVDITDATMLINYLLSNDPTGINMENANCDLSENGKVDITDATTLINYLLNNAW